MNIEFFLGGRGKKRREGLFWVTVPEDLSPCVREVVAAGTKGMVAGARR